ncbi:MAG: hypothetical protein AAGJ82_13420, partial [Bacteroidota bacterium]
HADLLPNWKLKIGAFLKRSPDALNSSSEEDRFAFASPRTWDYLAALLATCELLGEAPLPNQQPSTACMELIQGCVGKGLAVAFVSFLQNLRLPDPEAALAGEVKVDVETWNDSEIYVFFNSLTFYLERQLQSPTLLTLALRYFDLLQRVFDNGRRDLVYASLRRISRRGLLVNLLSLAQRDSPERKAKVMSAIEQLFADEGLNEFIDVFE